MDKLSVSTNQKVSGVKSIHFTNSLDDRWVK